MKTAISPSRSSWMRIAAIARSTYMEIVRDRLLYAILVVALLVTSSSFFLSTISIDQSSRVLQNAGLASIHLFTVLICVFVAANSIARDADRRVLYLLFPKPVSRSQYVLGKYLGFLYLAVTTLLILGVLFSIGIFATDRSLLHIAVVSLGYSFLEVSFLCALSLLFASFAAPLNAALYTFAFFVIGHSLGSVRQFLARSSSALLHGLVNGAYYLFPNLEKFDVRTSLLYGVHIPAADVAWTLLYWAVYTGIVLYLAVQVTKLREV